MKDLSFMVDENIKLNVRTTGVFVNDGKVLVHVCPGTVHYALPGGRVQANEDSITALKREVLEELDLEVENTCFIGAVENFFDAPEVRYHEYMWMIKADFVDKTVYNQKEINGYEQEDKMIFEWLDIDKLETVDFRPTSAIPYIKNIDNKVHHVISREK